MNIGAPVQEEYLLRKIEEIMDNDWLFERLDSYCSFIAGRPCADQTAFIKAVLIYEVHTACERSGIVVSVEVTTGNVHDSVVWGRVYDKVTESFKDKAQFMMDSACTTPWIAKRVLEDGLGGYRFCCIQESTTKIALWSWGKRHFYLRFWFLPASMQGRAVSYV